MYNKVDAYTCIWCVCLGSQMKNFEVLFLEVIDLLIILYFFFRLGSGKPQNLIIDDGKDDDEDETFVVEESAPPPVEPTQVSQWLIKTVF